VLLGLGSSWSSSPERSLGGFAISAAFLGLVVELWRRPFLQIHHYQSAMQHPIYE